MFRVGYLTLSQVISYCASIFVKSEPVNFKHLFLLFALGARSVIGGHHPNIYNCDEDKLWEKS